MPSYCRFIAVLIYQSHYETYWPWVVADLVHIFEAMISKARRSQVHDTDMFDYMTYEINHHHFVNSEFWTDFDDH